MFEVCVCFVCVCVCFVCVCVGVDFVDLTVTFKGFTDMRRVLNYACVYDRVLSS